MENDLLIRTLLPSDLDQMVLAFNEAFSDYFVPLYFTDAQFHRRFTKRLKIDYDLSAGAFDNEKLVGFIFTGTGFYKGKLTAYNGGTGVIPAYRGRGLGKKIYQYLLPMMKEQNIETCVLEVITENIAAIKTYESVGFAKNQLFKCFILSDKTTPAFFDKQIKKAKNPDWEIFKGFADIAPSFMDSFDILPSIVEEENIIIYEVDGKIVAYAVYDSGSGRIFQLAVQKRFRLRGIGSELINYIHNNSATKTLSIMNLNAANKGFSMFLEMIGFKNQINQYEMELSLNTFKKNES